MTTILAYNLNVDLNQRNKYPQRKLPKILQTTIWKIKLTISMNGVSEISSREIIVVRNTDQ